MTANVLEMLRIRLPTWQIILTPLTVTQGAERVRPSCMRRAWAVLCVGHALPMRTGDHASPLLERKVDVAAWIATAHDSRR